MTRKKMTHLNYYKRCMSSGFLAGRLGLCGEAYFNRIDKNLLSLFHPSFNDFGWMSWEGVSGTFWASGLKPEHPNICNLFTPLRQTIILFMAAMNGEL